MPIIYARAFCWAGVLLGRPGGGVLGACWAYLMGTVLGMVRVT